MPKPTHKIFLAEVTRNIPWNDFFPFYAHVWGLNIDNDYSSVAATEFDLESIGFARGIPIGSVLVNKVPYLSVDTLQEVIDNPSSFFFDNVSRFLYIHFEDNKDLHEFGENDIELGEVQGFYKTGSKSNGIFNGFQYNPRLLSVPNITDEKDDLFFSKQRFRTGVIEIENTDFDLSPFTFGANISRVNGNFVRVLEWHGEDLSDSEDYNNFNVVYQGVIDSVEEGRTLKITLNDLRSSLEIKSPQRYLQLSNYPDLKNPDKPQILPQMWGNCFSVPCLALNEDVDQSGGAVDYKFLICDVADPNDNANDFEIGSITRVLVDGRVITATPAVQYDTTDRIAFFELDRDFFAVDDGGSIKYEGVNKVAIDCGGYLDGSSTLIENGLDIIKDILLRNYDFPFNTTFYNVASWNAATLLAYDIGYYVNKPKTTQKQIEEISLSQIGKFIWNENLLFDFDYDDNEPSSATIPFSQLFPNDFTPNLNVDSGEVLSVFRVGYSREWDKRDTEEEAFSWEVDSSNQATALSKYNSTFEKDFKTLISNQVDAQSYASRILFFGGISNDQFEIITIWEKGQGLKAGDYVDINTDHPKYTRYGWLKCQIQSITPDIENWHFKMKVRVFQYGPSQNLLFFNGGRNKRALYSFAGEVNTAGAYALIDL